MSASNQNLSQQLLRQRCIDGELPPAERCSYLSSLRDVDQWRDLALGFVEQQLFCSALKDALGCSAESAADHKARSAVSVPAERPQSGESRPRTIGATTLARSSNTRQFAASVAAALCVGILSGLGVHWSLRGGGGGSSSGQPLAGIETAESSGLGGVTPFFGPAPASTAGQASPVTPSVVNLVGLGHPDQGPVSVPVYRSDSWQGARGWTPAPGAAMNEELQRQLEAQGILVDRQQQWYRATMPDGREVLVPTETVKLRYAVQ